MNMRNTANRMLVQGRARKICGGLIMPAALCATVMLSLMLPLLTTLLISLNPLTSLQASETDAALEDLRAANQARKTAADELTAWESEQQALQLLIAESERQQQVLQQSQERNQQSIAQFQKRIAQLDSNESHMLALDAVLLAHSKKINAALDQRYLRFPSSSISEYTETAADAAMQFMRSAARLDQALNTSKQWQVSLSEGQLNGKPLVYDQLRMGNVCAWWASRNGERGGIVKRADGQNTLNELQDANQVAAIVDAIAIVHGDRAPQLIALPMSQKPQLTTAASAKEVLKESAKVPTKESAGKSVEGATP